MIQDGEITAVSCLTDEQKGKMLRFIITLDNGSGFFVDAPKGTFEPEDELTITIEKK